MTLTSKVLIVGEAPTERYRFARQPALGGRCARRLVELMDLRDEQHLRELFDVENLFKEPQDPWDQNWARYKSVPLAESSHADFLVLCGPRVQHAFQVEADCEIVAVPMLTKPTVAACIPHPSGRCQSWKSERTLKRARRILEIARKHAEGYEPICIRHAEEIVTMDDEGTHAVYECGCEVVR